MRIWRAYKMHIRAGSYQTHCMHIWILIKCVFLVKKYAYWKCMHTANQGRMKVICAGFPKTGTTSMAAALRQLGYKAGAYLLHQKNRPLQPSKNKFFPPFPHTYFLCFSFFLLADVNHSPLSGGGGKIWNVHPCYKVYDFAEHLQVNLSR